MQYIKSRMLDRELKKGSAELLILSLVEDQPRRVVRRHTSGQQLGVSVLQVLLDLFVHVVSGHGGPYS